MATIYLICQGDVKSRFVREQSILPSCSLSNSSILQAKILAKTLRNIKFEMIYSCTSILSIETADVLMKKRAGTISVIKKLAMDDFKVDFQINGECFDLSLCIKTMMANSNSLCSSVNAQLKTIEKRLLDVIDNVGKLYRGNVVIVLEPVMVKLLMNYYLAENNSKSLWETISPISLSIIHSDNKGRHLIINNDISNY